MGTNKKFLAVAVAGLGAGFAMQAARLVFRQARKGRVRGKVVLITGGSRGLGLELARQFARAGALVMLVARDEEELQRARRMLLAEGAALNAGSIGIAVADVSQRDGADYAVFACREQFGRVDILINNAGIITVAPFVDTPLETFERVMRINFFSALHMAQAVVPEMRARHSGSIVNIASIGGKVAVPHLLPYVASKFALTGFSEGLHAELAADGIRVLTVCPGLMRTGSFVQAEFAGNREGEYRWFSLGSTLPGLNTSSRAAARKIFYATLAGAAEITITPQAWLAARAVGLAPALSARAAALVNRVVLPKPAGKTEHVRGAELPVTPLPGIRQWSKHLQRQGNQFQQ